MCDLMWQYGRTMRVVHQDELTRDEKDVLRFCGKVQQHGKMFLLPIAEEPNADDLALAAFEEFEDDQRTEQLVEVTTVEDEKPVFVPMADPEDDSDEPTLSDLEKLTVAQLKELAAKEQLDVSDLKLKADLVGRLCAHFGIEL